MNRPVAGHMRWTRERVLREAQEWVWARAGFQHLRRDWCHALRQEGSDTLHIAWLDVDDGAHQAREKLAAMCAEQRCTRLRATLPDTSDQASLEALLRRRGATVELSHEVLGLDLGEDIVGTTDERLRAELVHRPEQWRWAMQVAQQVWGGPEPTAEALAEAEQELSKPITERREFQVLVRTEHEPVATGGVTLAGRVARLWGACTTPKWRGFGAYRATVGARLAEARRHGATLGLAKALSDTSAPILTRLGFTHYGSTRTFALTL